MVKRLWLHGEREVESTVLPTLEERDIIEKNIYINNLMLPIGWPGNVNVCVCTLKHYELIYKGSCKPREKCSLQNIRNKVQLFSPLTPIHE